MSDVSEISTEAKFQEWMCAWSQVVAKAWAHSSVAKALVENPRETLKKEVHYHLPHHIDLKVKGPESDSSAVFPGIPNGLFDAFSPGSERSVTLELVLPEAPKDPKDWSIVLSGSSNADLRVMCVCFCV